MYKKVRTFSSVFFVVVVVVVVVYSHVISVTFDKFCSVYDIFVRYL